MAGSDLVIRLVGDTSRFRRDMGQAETTAEKFQRRIKLAGAAIAAGAAVVGAKAIQVASDTNEALSKSEAVFGTSAGQVKAFAETAAANYGLSKRAALDFTGAMGSVLVAQGSTQKEAASLSLTYTKLAADLGSFNNTSTEEAAEALKASITGEYEQLKKYGVVINDVRLNQEAQRIGMVKTGATFTAEQKKQLSYNIVMHDTAQAQGDFARTSGGLANSQKILTAQLDDAQGKLGAKLLPVMIKVTRAGIALMGWADRNKGVVKALVIVVGSLATAILAANVVIYAHTAATKLATAATHLQRVAAMRYVVALKLQDAWSRRSIVTSKLAAAATRVQTVAQRGLNFAMRANPIGLVITALAALTAGFVYAYKRSETFRRIVNGALGAVRDTARAVVGWLREHWPLLLTILTGPFGLAVAAIAKNWDRILAGARWMRDGLVRVFRGVADVLTAPFRAAVDGIRYAWNSTLGGKGFRAPGWLPGIGGKGFTIPYLAGGGTAMAGRAHIVGERGPELFIPGRTGAVVPNHALGGPQVIETHIHIGEEVVRVVRSEVREHDRATRNAVRAGARRSAWA